MMTLYLVLGELYLQAMTPDSHLSGTMSLLYNILDHFNAKTEQVLFLRLSQISPEGRAILKCSP